MRPASTNTVGAVEASSIIVLDYRGSQNRVGVQVVKSGTNTYTVQMTADDVFADGYSAASGNWFSVPIAAMVGATTSQMAELTCPATALRVNVTAFTNGGVTMRVLDISGAVA